jgi:allophanate hydrolase subunit 2
MLKDHPTIGGYPKIGTVIAKDLAKLAQSQPRQKIQFRLVN